MAYSNGEKGPVFHDDPKFARVYRTRKGARIAISNFRRRYGAERTRLFASARVSP